MRIDLEQFLAIAVGLGAAGAVGIGVYSMRGDTEDEIVDVAEQEASAEAAIAPPSSAAVPLPAAPAEPVPEDEALSPVVPDADPLEAYGPEGGGDGGGWGGGPDVETPDW
jgi:hypothetical protein